ncbi:MAG TPA: DinB family protein [Gemmatimonadaceae bacterium]|nr:DinB family protein [Gemmatimonadaceae bacterium]
MTRPDDMVELERQLAAVEAEARALVRALDAETGTRRPCAGGWSVAECLDHLAVANRVYLGAMREPAARARRAGRMRRRPAMPGLLGGLFVRSLEPPARHRSRAPRNIVPRVGPALADAFDAFLDAHAAVGAFLRENADLDLASIRFPNPLVRGIRFSLATGLHVIAAHERRHLWQARKVVAEARGSRD